MDTRQLVLKVAVAAPVYHGYDYLPPPDWPPEARRPGVRLRVPFGQSERLGLLLGVSKDAPISTGLKPALALLDAEPLLTPEDLGFLTWAAGYYCAPPGLVLFGALPPGLRRGAALPSSQRRGWKLTAAGRAIGPERRQRAPRQAQLLELLRPAEAGLTESQLRQQTPDALSLLRQLRERGWTEEVWLDPPPSPWAPTCAGVNLNPDQASAIDQVRAHGNGFGVFLLEGVTGSGKTEVYLELVQDCLRRGRQALVLIPEISLTPQLHERFRSRFGHQVAVFHSGLSDRQREQTWLGARNGEVGIILGTRSAIFLPMPKLGLFLVDEEHDLSFKQQEGFRYSARDLAVWRSRQRGCPVLLGSATPSLESLQNCRLGRYQRLSLPQRAGGATTPRIELVNIRSQPLEAGLSRPLLRMIDATLEGGNQVLLFLNRRGYAPVMMCHDCGWFAGCPRCDARMTFHKLEQRLWCHHCGHQSPFPSRCPDCGGADLRWLGRGTERIEEWLGQRFPGVGIGRIDRDTTRRVGALEQRLAEARDGTQRLLLGTQMLAKGHHFPDVTLVGILDMDAGLFGTDFRASERMAQLVVQVAGRAGRAEKPGRVLLQTRHPDHPMLQTLVRQGYPAFAALALEERQAARLPPFNYQALLRAEARNQETPLDFLDEVAALAHGFLGEEIQLGGPIPAPMERRRGQTRAQLLFESPRRDLLQALLRHLLPEITGLKTRGRVRWSIDVDPQESD